MSGYGELGRRLREKGSSVLSYLHDMAAQDAGMLHMYGHVYAVPALTPLPPQHRPASPHKQLAPAVPAQQDFVAQWKAVTHYFIENKEHKVGVEHTALPGHLSSLLGILVREEGGSEGGSTGPCMEYLLQHCLLDTLYTLARTDCPPGMKQVVLQFYIKLLSRITQPLLPHINVHKPVQRMVRLCGETPAAPSENEEIQFLCTVCAKLRSDPYLVNFFIETPKPSSQASRSSGSGGQAGKNGKPGGEAVTAKQTFTLVDSLLTLMHSPDARVGVKACEGLLLCASLPETASAHAILHHTQLCDQLTEQLCTLYQKLPKVMDPADIYCVQAKWGLDVMSETEDHLNFPGKRSLISFLSWLDYCDQLICVAHPDIAAAMAQRIRNFFLGALLEPAILNTSEAVAITATAHLGRCLRHVYSKPLVQEFVSFIIGTAETPELPDEPQDHKLRQRFLDRCDHLSEELSITTLKVFEILLQKNNPIVIHNLFLRNLLGQTYLLPKSAPVSSISATAQAEAATAGQADSTASATEHPEAAATSAPNVPQVEENSADGGKGEAGGSTPPADSSGAGPQADSRFSIAGDSSEEGSVEDTPSNHPPPTSNDLDLAPGQAVDPDEEITVHQIVNCFLTLLPEDAKSSYQTGDSGYETYLRDANRQFLELSNHFSEVEWPSPPSPPAHTEAGSLQPFFEGTFLKMLLDRLSKMFDQSYDVNLHVTSVISCLALIPHPAIDQFLLNPLLRLQPSAHSLSTVLHKLAADVHARLRKTPELQKRLVSVRRQLMGYNTSIRSVEDSELLAGVIVLEEFCKELAAIAFVKLQAAHRST